MLLKITHTTRYDFETPVSYGLQQLRMTPKSTRAQNVLSWTTTIKGGRTENQYEDFHRNQVDLISIDADATALELQSEGEVDMTDTAGIVGPHEGSTPLWLFELATPLTQAGPGVRALTKAVTATDPLEKLHALSAVIRAQVGYEIGSSSPDWTAEQAIEAGKGVCQDHTHIFVAAARLAGFPARYVSGYLMMNDRVDQDATHAWAEAHVPGIGWVGFDVSNGISPDTRYVRAATGRDYSEAAPVRGTRLGGEGETLSVSVEVAQQ